MDKNLQRQMAFNERLEKVLEAAQGIKPFNYDNVFKESNELKKQQHNLFQVKLKALTMEEKDVDLWWDAMQNVVQKDIRKAYKMYERNEKLYTDKISHMEKVIPSFQYEPLIFTLELATPYEEKQRGNINGARPSRIRT